MHSLYKCVCGHKNLLPAANKAGLYPPDSISVPLKIQSIGYSYAFASLMCRPLSPNTEPLDSPEGRTEVTNPASSTAKSVAKLWLLCFSYSTTQSIYPF